MHTNHKRSTRPDPHGDERPHIKQPHPVTISMAHRSRVPKMRIVSNHDAKRAGHARGVAPIEASVYSYSTSEVSLCTGLSGQTLVGARHALTTVRIRTQLFGRGVRSVRALPATPASPSRTRSPSRSHQSSWASQCQIENRQRRRHNESGRTSSWTRGRRSRRRLDWIGKQRRVPQSSALAEA